MIYDDLVELHNVAAVVDRKTGQPANPPFANAQTHYHGLRLQRVPEDLRLKLNEGAQRMMLCASAVEIRFVADGPVRITLSSDERRLLNDPVIYQGDYCRERLLPVIGQSPTVITLEQAPRIQELPMGDDLTNVTRYDLIDPAYTFAPSVTRLRLPTHGGPFTLYGIEPAPGVSCRPPKADELPGRRMLAYGTSITHGSASPVPELTYASLAAYQLQADLINLGSSGSAFCEYELADYIAGRDDWDFATLALSVNMQGFSQEEFRSRTGYMVKTVAGAHPDKPVFAITLWPYFRDVGIPDGGEPMPSDLSEVRRLAQRMRQDLRDGVTAAGCDNLHLLEGPELFGPFSGLTADLIHPGPLGMITMGHNLAAAIKPHL